MKKIICRELAKFDCDFEAIGETSDEVTDKIFTHAETIHQKEMATMPEEGKIRLVEKMNEILDKQEPLTNL
ncbi:MAG: DUF1059 domain-containing protein [bacterium]|nr:DUF1059 domain-containing protein [bacterium]